MPTFTTPAAITTVLNIPAGHVQFIAADRADTVVEVRPADAAKSRDVHVAEETGVEFADGVLRVTAPAKPVGSVEVTVQLPAGSRIEARTASARFRAVGRLGELDYESAHGDITVDEAASTRLVLSAGDVTVGRLTGPADIRTDRGDIRITEAVRGRVVLATRSGDVSIGAAAGVSAALDAGTGHGRISNTLKNDGATELDIHATTSHGDIAAHSL